MRTLKALIDNNNTIWIYCKDKELAKSFLEQCENEGFLALNGQKPTELFHHSFYGISDDMTMGFLSSMIWSMTLRNGNDNHVRIDYEKFISGEDNYFFHPT